MSLSTSCRDPCVQGMFWRALREFHLTSVIGLVPSAVCLGVSAQEKHRSRHSIPVSHQVASCPLLLCCRIGSGTSTEGTTTWTSLARCSGCCSSSSMRFVFYLAMLFGSPLATPSAPPQNPQHTGTPLLRILDFGSEGTSTAEFWLESSYQT